MEMHSVSSSNVAAVGYDPSERELRVRFHDGGTFAYDGVPEAVYDAFVNAPSIGSFFYHNIRNQYAYRQV